LEDLQLSDKKFNTNQEKKRAIPVNIPFNRYGKNLED